MRSPSLSARRQPQRTILVRNQLDTRRFKLAKPNYRHAKKQKETARKARQDAKQQRRATAPENPEVVPGADVPVPLTPDKAQS